MKKVEMKITMQVTIPQALALQAMFEHWNRLGGIGSSRTIGFYVDGDGDFHPEIKINLPRNVPRLTNDLRERAVIDGESTGDLVFDYDPIAWALHES